MCLKSLSELFASAEPTRLRAVSDAVGVVLLIGIVFLGVGALIGFGVSGIGDDTERVQEATAEEDLTRIHEAIERERQSLTAQGGQQIELGLGEVTANAGYDARGETATVRLETGTYGPAGGFSPNQTVVDQTVSVLSFESRDADRQLRYELGAVITAPGSNAQGNIIRDPPLSYSQRLAPGTSHEVTTLRFPLVSVTTESRIRDTLQLRTSATASLDVETVESHALRLTLSTPFADAWAQLYRDRLPDSAVRETTTTDSEFQIVIIRGENPCTSTPCNTDHTFLDISYQEVQLARSN